VPTCRGLRCQINKEQEKKNTVHSFGMCKASIQLVWVSGLMTRKGGNIVVFYCKGGTLKPGEDHATFSSVVRDWKLCLYHFRDFNHYFTNKNQFFKKIITDTL